jgi:hypothetical protein
MINHWSGQRPAVSCVLIFFNGVRFLDEAIASVVGQANFDQWELVLVDDGSTDGSTDVAQRWSETDPARIRVVEHPGHANLGMSAARNLGVAEARGEFIGFLDCDDIWLPSLLAHRMKVARASPDADVILGGTWRWYSWSGAAGQTRLDHRMDLPPVRMLTIVEPPQLFGAIYGTPGAWNIPAMCSVLVKRASFLAIGGCATEFRSLHEDQVLYTKMALELRSIVDPRPLSLYRQHPGSACATSVAAGDWSANVPSPLEAKFLSWMRDHVRGRGGELMDVVDRNLDRHFTWTESSISGRRPLRASVRQRAPKSLVRLARRARRALRPGSTVRNRSVIEEWSAQVVPVAALRTSGSVLVAAPTGTTGGVVPTVGWLAGSFPTASHVASRSIDTESDDRGFDFVVVPAEAAMNANIETVMRFFDQHLAPSGSGIALLPGRDMNPGKHSVPRASASAAMRQWRHRFAEMELTVETFGNPTTAEAARRGVDARDVPGVLLDVHDRTTEVLVAVTLISTAARAPHTRRLPSGALE